MTRWRTGRNARCFMIGAGCLRASVMDGTYDPYPKRMLDMVARLRLLRALEWLRQDGAGAANVAQRLETLPAELRGARFLGSPPTASTWRHRAMPGARVGGRLRPRFPAFFTRAQVP